jgi:beta-aspartyl-peptidase (threonine type)
MIAIAIHGGAGTLPRQELTREVWATYRAGLEEALNAGYAVLERGASSLDAIERSVRILEDDPLWNAGRGAVFTEDGRNELDAAIMQGATLQAGAVAGLSHVRNPVSLARLVMERSPHVLLAGVGAEDFAIEQGVELTPRSWFHTERRWDQWLRARTGDQRAGQNVNYFGTVGAVAVDSHGNVAAATSTGGMTGKRWGRIGDSPLIGAGTYAANAGCAVSATGHGEYLIRATVAREVSALMEYRGLSVAAAAREVVQVRLKGLGGEGGLIAVDRAGNLALEFNSEGMFRAARAANGRHLVACYAEEEA